MTLTTFAFGAAALLVQLVGVLSIAHAYRRRHRYRGLARLATAPGKIVRVGRHSDGGAASSTIEYRDADGTELSLVCGLPQKASVEGATVTVAFDPADPSGTAMVRELAEDVRSGWWVGGVFLAIGTVALVFALLDLFGV
ncbi:MAG: DUF3592 domain-containing protein [Myxococcales bacterium]|nr:DUF3592 domain-containing protein [Myxococcales bacterium]